ncbi:MAG TPA: hypothetical protein VNV43_13070 [Candidatus Acidoferrales bacterium]|nr:hypothetical protein [Candidatus Acidoferrales bacterium]
MISFFLNDLVKVQATIGTIRQHGRDEVNRIGTPAMCGREKRSEFSSALPFVADKLAEWKLDKTRSRLEHFQTLLNGDQDIPCTVINSESHGIMVSLDNEIKEQRLVYVPSSKADYFEKEKLFGDAVYSAFPKAREEIKDAGNCLACDLNEAAIFHLMRVVEYGLRALAKKLGVTITDEDMEYKQWQQIIDAIYSRIRVITESPKGTPKEKAEMREFYNGAMSEFSGFKDVWRNSIMHSRGRYKPGEASSVYDRVKVFMQRLAAKVVDAN